MSHTQPHARKPLAIAIFAATLALHTGFVQPLLSDAGQARAEEQVNTYAIDAGPLGAVLGRFANEAGVLLSFDAALTNGKHSPGLQGRYSVEQGFAQLLAGSGLQAVSTGADSFGIRPESVAGDVLELSTMSISGKAPGSITEGTGSYTTYSTSSSTRLNLSLQETPQSVTVLTRQRLDDQKLDDLVEALDATAGITVKTYAYGGDSPTIYSRGSTINNFQLDGVPTSSSMANYLHDMTQYDRVEVVRGATGIMSGLGNPSATVNLIRKRPTSDPQVSLTTEAGNWDRYGSGVDMSGPLTENRNIRGRLVADYKHQHGWTDNYQQAKTSLYGIGELDLNEDTLFTLGFSHIKRDTNSPTSAFPMVYTNGNKVDMDASDNDSPTWAYYDHELSSVFASLEHRLASGWNVKSELRHSQHRYDYMHPSVTQFSLVEGSTNSTMNVSRGDGTTKQDNLDTYVTGPFSLFGRQHELIAGITLLQQRVGYDSLTRTSSNVIPDIFTWVEDTPKPSFEKTGKNSGREYQNSAYLNSRFHFTDNTSLLIGSRLTDWKWDNESVTFSTGNRSKSRNRESGIFTPYLGIVHILDETWSIYASYTKIFQPHDSFIHQYVTNPAPEEGATYETGIKASFNEGRLNANLSLFRSNQDNLAVWSNTTYTYEMYNDTTTEGVELELNGEITTGWNFSSGYAYSVTRNNEDKRINTLAPRHSLKTFTTYRLPGELDKFTLGGGVNWESKTGSDLSVITQGSYALFSLMGRYDIDQNLSVSVNVNNLFDKEHKLAGIRGTYGPPRNFITSLKYTY